MLKNKVFFLVFSKSKALLTHIPQLIHHYHSTPEVSTFSCETSLFETFKDPINFLRVVILDLNYEEEAFTFLKDLKTLNTSPSLICGFSKNNSLDFAQKFFIQNGNIFFNSGADLNAMDASIKMLISTIKKFQLVTVNPNHLIMSLTHFK